MTLTAAPSPIVDSILKLAAARTLEDVTRVVRSAARQLAEADGATFVLRDEGFCHYVDEDAIGPLWKGQRFPLDRCVTGWVMLNRTHTIIPDIERDPRVPLEAYRATFVRSMAAIPIRKDDPIGAIGVYWTDLRSPSADELRDLQALADAASVAMENVRLMLSLRASRDEARASADENRRLLNLASSQLAERRRAEENLRAFTEHMDLALAAGNMGTWTIDLETSTIARSVWFSRMLNLPHSALLAAGDFEKLIHPDDRAKYDAALTSAKTRGTPIDITYRITSPTQRELSLRTVGRVVATNRSAMRIYGATLDLTDIKSLENQLFHAQKLESVARLAGGIAHDFNNALTTIFCWLDLADRHAAPDSPIAHAFSGIQHASRHAASLTRQLLAFARKQVLDTKPLNLNDLVRASLPLLQPLVGDDIVVVAPQAFNLPAVSADAGQIEQILMNLSANARDAMPGGGTLTINTGVSTESGASRVVLSISDTGSGMPPEVVSRIFDPFFTTKPVGKGTGLGLSTVLGIVEQHGGTVNVISTPGRGTRFDISFPAVAAPVEVELPPSRDLDAPPPIVAAPEQSPTILVVDDQALVRDVTAAVLSQAGYRVLQADSPAAAISLVLDKQTPIDMLISDMVMPGMSGAQLATTLKAKLPGLRVLLTSGYSSHRLEQLSPEAAQFELLSKPYAPAELTKRVRASLLAAV